MIDEKGRECDPETVCFGLGQHYHCVNCWKPGGMYVCILGNIRQCDGKVMWEDKK